jgi:hypothetical protein
MIPTRARLAAGICVLSACLFISSAGGAIALADTESTSPGAHSEGAGSPSGGFGSPSGGFGSVDAPAMKVANPFQSTLQAAVRGVTSALNSIGKLTPPQMNFQGQTATKPTATSTPSTNSASGPTAADPSPTTPADPSKAASDQTVAASDQTVVASDPTVVASESTVVPPVTNPPATLSTVVEPVTKAVATVVNVFASVPGAILALPTSPQPIIDAITLIQEMLTSVTNVVVTIAELPSNLYSLLSSSPTTVTATSHVDAGVSTDASAPVVATRASQSLEPEPFFVAGGMALPADIAPLETLGDIATTGLRNELPVSGISSPAQNVIVQSGLGSFLEHAVRALFVPASLSALAAVALPGVGGLLIICALGVRFGYRQAKAHFEVRRAGIASFAGPGPLGVVRSGSLIALRPSVSEVRPNTARAASRQDEAA